ncbi:MAG: methyl-accepting chemotaxis protein [Colwellia sp.]|nr:methyl-accepting chemotaxis protein [Colwellia sp.]
MKMTIRNKLTLCFSGFTGLVIIFAGLAWLYIDWLGKDIKEITQWRVPVVKSAVSIEEGTYEAIITIQKSLLKQEPETDKKVNLILAKINNNVAKLDELGQAHNDKTLLKQVNSVKESLSTLNAEYQQAVEALHNSKKSEKSMDLKGSKMIAETGGFAQIQVSEYNVLYLKNTPQEELNNKVQKYILVNKIKSQAYSIIEYEKQERLYQNGEYFQKMQQNLPALQALFVELRKIKLSKLENEILVVVETVTNDYAKAANRWFEHNNNLKTIVNSVNETAELTKIAASTVKNNGWEKVTEKASASESLITEANTIITAVIIFVILLGVIVIIVIPNNIVKSMNTLKSLIRNVEQTSDFTLRANTQSKDEIAEMALAFNKMLQTLQKAMNEVADASTQIATASEETSMITEQTQGAIEVQQKETAQVAVAMNEMTATVSEVANNTTNTYEAAAEANKQVESGTQSMQQTILFVTELAGIIEKTSETIAELENESKNIYSVLDVVNGIAEQTNLLALNAAIEAARAGEHGRGFAVVADEVKNLAQGTQASIGQISDIIEKLQSGSKNAVVSMRKSQEKTENANIQANKTGEAFIVLKEVILNINDMSSQIATAAEEQGVVAEEINRNIVKISDMTDQTAEGSVQTSEASQDLSRLAAGLNQLMHKFVI